MKKSASIDRRRGAHSLKYVKFNAEYLRAADADNIHSIP
jgi:hypothetical protein